MQRTVYISAVFLMFIFGACAETPGTGLKADSGVFVLGASLWNPSGAEQLGRMLRDGGYPNVKTANSRSNPWVYWQHRMWTEGRQAEFGKSLIPYKQEAAAKDIAEMEKRMKAGKWDSVVFMGHSTEPEMVGKLDVEDNFAQFIAKIKELAPDAELVAVMTWYKDSVAGTTSKMWDDVQTLYRNVAAKNNIRLAPSGMAFKRVYEERPDLNIRVSEKDGHPNVYGQYLNGCVVYAVLTGKSPVGLPAVAAEYASLADLDMESDAEHRAQIIAENKLGPAVGKPVPINSEVARYLQETAWKVCLEEPLSGVE